MIFMNEYEVQRQAVRYDAVDTPNLYTASRVLYAVMTWVNNNSDGWPYWQAPQKATQRLQTLLWDVSPFERNPTDCSDADLKKALTPIKSFLTRKGARFDDVVKEL
jgi:ethanolamine utilization protein EutP (predicted NTPase)